MTNTELLEFHLKELHQRYHRGEVSALVGSGLSKNVNGCFPDWNQLLDDMVQELFKVEIEDAYRDFIHKNWNIKISETIFSANKRKEIISREGYLGIVSKYIERKGYREAIESYIEERIPYIDRSTDCLVFGGDSKKDRISIKPSDIRVHAKLLEGAWENIYSTNYDETLEYAKEKKNKSWNIIKEAKELSFSKSAKSIIKLHGSLHNGSDKRSFKFDGNPHQQYIISLEDYKTYPKEHEAFTQLMRISLLQGTFCLFGFSGDDPNFISWVEWVRDIIERGASEPLEDNDKQKYKVFLFAIDDSMPSAEKRLFYENHRILYVPLQLPKVMSIIRQNDPNDIPGLLIGILSYLYKPDASVGPFEKPEIAYRKTWSSVWSSTREAIKPNKFPKITRVTVDLDKKDDISKLVQYQRVPAYCYNQKHFLSSISELDEYSREQIDLILQAIKDIGIPVTYYPHIKEILDKSNLSSVQETGYQQLLRREETLSVGYDASDGDTYDDVLRNSFNLNFSALRESLEKWHPTGVDTLKKALYTSLFDRDSAKDILLAFLDSEFNDRERRFATDLLNFIDFNFKIKYSTDSFENQGISGLDDLSESIYRSATSSDTKVTQFGSTENKPQLKYEDTIRFLNFLIEAPHFTEYTGFIETVKPHKWFTIFKTIFEDHPMPALFYSIQYRDEKFLRRIGQEFAFSDKLFEQGFTPHILKRLLKSAADDNTPKFFLQQVLTVAGEMFDVVNSKDWEDDFVKIWDKYILPKYASIEGHNDFFGKFAYKGISHLRSKKVKSKVLLDAISHRSENIEFSIGITYHIHSGRNTFEVTDELEKAADEIVHPEMMQEEFTMALNVKYLLDEESLATMNRLIPTIVRTDAKDYVICSTSHIAKGKESLESFRKIITEHSRLWDNGIHSDGGVSQADFLRLSSLNRKFKFTDPYVSRIYERLVASFKAIISNSSYQREKSGEGFFSFFDKSPLFREMEWFLEEYEKILVEKEDFHSILGAVKRELSECREFSSISEGLLSDDNAAVVQALRVLNRGITFEKIKSEENNVILMLDRIIFKKSEGLESCLFCAAYYLKNFISKDHNMLSAFLDRYMKIISLYTCAMLLELNQNVCNCSEYLIEIADVLKNKGIDGKGVDRWLNVKKKNRFYFGRN